MISFVNKQLSLPGFFYKLGAVFLALVAVSYVAISVELFVPSYMVNDNIAIMDYAVQGLPIDFTGVLFTGFLHLAYAHAPRVPWYGLSLYALHCLSVFLWLYIIWRALHPWWLAGVFSGIFLVYYFPFLIFLDYTSTGAMLCMAALAWTCLDILEQRPGYRRFLLAGFVFMFGMVVRPQVPLGALVYLLPVACIVAVRHLCANYAPREPEPTRQSTLGAMPYGLLAVWLVGMVRQVGLYVFPFRHGLRRLSLAALMFLFPAVANFAADAVYRQVTLTPQQAQFDAFNAVRGRLQGLPERRMVELINDPPVQDAAHLSRDQTSDFFHWRFLDERVYTEPALKTMLEKMPPPAAPYREFARELRERFDSGPEFALLLCCVPLFLLVLMKHPWMGVTGMLLPLYACCLAALLSVFVAFTPRTEMPFAIGFSFLSLVAAGTIIPLGRHQGKLAGVCMIVSCALGLLGAYRVLLHTEFMQLEKQISAARTEATLGALNREFSGSVVVLEPEAGLQVENLNPLDTISFRFHPVDLGWNTFSPRFYQEISHLGISHGYELMDTLIDREHAYTLGNSWWAYTMLDCLSKQYQYPIRLVRVKDLYQGDSLFRYVLEKPGGLAKRH